MYNESLNAENKIITSEDLYKIFEKMNDKLVYYKKISDGVEQKNKMLEFSYQSWDFKDEGSKLSFDVSFYDHSEIKFDNYNNFISIFNSRLDEIKSIYCSFRFYYSVKENGYRTNNINQHIILNIHEDKLSTDFSISSNDDKINDIYELIKNIVLNAPVKYDEVIKKRKSIISSVGFAIGVIPAIIISLLLLLSPVFREIYSNGFVIFPGMCLFLGILFGKIIGPMTLNKYYSSIMPEQRYAYYDSNKGTSVYRDDVNDYISKSEVLIGSNCDNMMCREKIIEIRNKYKEYIYYELLVIVLVSVIVLFL